ncbi:hypothetical protein P3T76_006133 [Phytophthora citrophthora]|uniref:Uncharacterized protein n=1 Tax=Phytophthora citrophthora TaxID=4793 RepID=A0AAD9GQA8_9STRA|nr:hypothetical protein P3T76_006133 [Phytophthora citrophthora]
MAEPSSASEVVQAVAGDVDNHNGDFFASGSSPGGGKRSATEAFEKDSVEDLKDSETTLDDVLVSPLAKKSKLLDEELPDVDDNEEFPQQEEDLDAELALGLENGEKEQVEDLNMDNGDLNMGNGDLDIVQDDLELNPEGLNMEQEQKEEEEEDSEPPTSQNNEIDIVDVDSDEEEEVQEFQEFQEEEEDDEQETARAITQAQNQREARQLLQQLDDSARSKLCLTALEKYGEELFYGHEDARDAILVDACAQDSVLSLMRDAIRVRDLYMRGSSAAAPVELDDDSDSGDETGGYEDDTEGGDEDKTGESNDDEIVVISEEEQGDDDESDNEASKRAEESEEKQQSASDDNDGDDEESKEEEDAALGDVGENVASGSPVAT